MKIFKNIVQGDSYKAKVKIKNADGTAVDRQYISHIYFTSKSLNLQKEITYDTEMQDYILSITPTETASFKPEEHSFDLTIYFTEQSIKTATYEGQILVLEKHNEVTI